MELARRARRIAGRQRPRLAAGLARGEAALARLRARVAPPAAPEPRRPAAAVPDYGGLWSPTDEADARGLILLERDAERFDQAGASQADWLANYYDAQSVVLDFGCGIGRVARHVAPHVRELWAVDASDAMLELARTHLAGLANVRFARSTGTAMPGIADASVDLAYAILVLQHVEREDALLLLRELRRVLRPTGVAFVTYPNLLADGYFDAFVGYAERREVWNASRARFYTPQEVERIVPAAGFATQDILVSDEIVVVLRPLEA